MLNIVALGLLISYLGTVVVLVPEPSLTRANQHVRLQAEVQPPEAFDASAQAAVSGLQNVVGTTESGHPSAIEKVKEKLQQGCVRTAHGIECVKESAKDAYEKAKQGMHVKAQDAYSSVPSKDELASYVPGRDKTRDALETLKKSLESSQKGIGEAIRDAASHVPGKDSGSDALQTLNEKLESAQQGIQKSIRDAISSFPGKEAGYTENVGEVFEGVKEHLSAAEEHNKKKVGWFRKKPQSEGGALVGKIQEFCSWFAETNYWGKDAGGGDGSQVSGNAKESYRFLVESAKGQIEGAREVFERAVMSGSENGGGVEWRERYNYLADSAKGALEGAKEVFERVVAAGGMGGGKSSTAGGKSTAAGGAGGKSSVAEKANRAKETASEAGQRGAGEAAKMVDWSAERGGGNISAAGERLKRAAEHTKHRLSAGVHSLLRALYLASYSAAFGITLWMTFVSGHLLAASLPRHQLGLLQSKLFPVYLRLTSFGLAVCFAIHAILHPWPSADHPERWQYGNFIASLTAALLNTFIVEPTATKVMFEKLKLEKEEVRGEVDVLDPDEATKNRVAIIDAKFKGLHTLSSYLNMINVSGLSWHLWYLSNRLMV